MPIYDLKCNDCTEVIEDVLLNSYKSELPKCTCGGETHKLLSTPSFTFAQHAGVDKGRLMQFNPRKAKRT